MSNIRDFINGNSRGPQKTQLVVDLTEAYRKLNLVLERTEALSERIANNLKNSAPGTTASGRAKTARESMNFGFQDVPATSGKDDSAASSMSFGRSVLNFGKGALLASGAAAVQMVDPAKYIENEIARTRYNFFSGSQPGAQTGGQVFQNMMNMGTATSSMDAARASMAAMSMGMMPTGKNGMFNTFATGAATFSNLVQGAGLEGGMQAMGALNQAANVNKLRMIGINVRDSATGMMRSFDDIANDLWKVIDRSKTGTAPITVGDLSLSLQPGNALASMLDQYFGNDPVLRQGVIAALYQKARTGGGGLTRNELAKSGALAEVSRSIGKTNAALYGAVNAYTTPGVQGVMEANQIIAGAANIFRDNVAIFGEAVKRISELKTLSGAGGGAGGTLLGFIGGAITNVISGFFSKLGDLIMGRLAASLTGEAATGGGALGTTGLLGSLGTLGALSIPAAYAVAGSMVMAQNIEIANDPKKRRKWNKQQTKFAQDTVAQANGTPFSQTDLLTGNIGVKPTTLTGNMSTAGVGGEGVGPADGVYSPLKGALSIPTNGEFWNRAAFRHQPHRGVDFRARAGTPVYAIKGGKVIKSGTEGELGNMIRISHPDGYNTVYAHLSSQSVSLGESVDAGSPIGLSGYSGAVYPAGPDGAHLHVALERGGGVSDPMPYLGGATTPTAEGVYSSASASTTSLFKSSEGGLFRGGAVPLFGASSGGGVGGDVSGGVNYGGVTVHINVAKGTHLDEQKLAHEVKRILEDQEQIRMAVIR